MKAGVLALQGAFREHREVLGSLGVETIEVRTPEHLTGVDVLFLPGGESTTMSKLLDSSGLREPLAERLAAGMPAFATCAGLILLARDAMGEIDVTVRRNAYGRQQQSFESFLAVDRLAGGEFPGVFIRAPMIEAVGETVDVLATHDDHAVLVRDGAVWGATFHPELSGDPRLHQLFLKEVAA